MAREFDSRSQRHENSWIGHPFPKLSEGSYEVPSWQHSKKLVVLIHGLNSSPLAWGQYLDVLSADAATCCFAPLVYQKGYCKLKEAARPVLEVVRQYAQQFSDNPIVLVGHSNGARIAAYVERKLEAKEIRLISIAGPHSGSKLVSWITSCGIESSFGFGTQMVEEWSYQGEWVQKKLKKWQNKQLGHKVHRLFFATADDMRVFPWATSFPKLPNSEYVLISGESHVTIIDAVKDRVLQEIGA